MAAIYSNGGNRWNILGFNVTKRDALSSVYKISMVTIIYMLVIVVAVKFRTVSCVPIGSFSSEYQGRRENSQGPGQILPGGPMTSLFLS
jgi:hypothetical protein